MVRELDLFNIEGQGETKLPSLTQVHKFEVINFYDLLRVSLNMVAEENQVDVTISHEKILLWLTLI